MRFALAAIALSLISSLVLRIFPHLGLTAAALCLQPLALLGGLVALLTLIAVDRSFRVYLVAPLANRRYWATAVIATAALLVASLLIFKWAINDPTGELEGASMFWGHPFPWLVTGYFYAGFGGESIRAQGGYAYIFLHTPWYENPRVIAPALLSDLAFFLTFSLVLVHALRLGNHPSQDKNAA